MTTKKVESYTHNKSKRKNIPPAKIAAEGQIPKVENAKYGYSAHLPPRLCLDPDGESDFYEALVEKAISGQKLTSAEKDLLRAFAKSVSQPWMEWSGKKEEHDRKFISVDPVALQIHERISANAIVRAASRQDVQRDLFADPQQTYNEIVQFYRHDIEWANRLVLGDSLTVMSSLSRRENLAGKVQTIYMDPPYGIKFASNFMPAVGQKPDGDRDREEDLSREQEVVKAFRDTWRLGLHSYLSYLRDRLMVAKELLSQTGSIFVQIGDANYHTVKCLLDEVFGSQNSVVTILIKKKGSQKGELLESVNDFLLWYAKDKNELPKKYNALFEEREVDDDLTKTFRWAQFPDGSVQTLAQLNLQEGVETNYVENPAQLFEDFPGVRLFKCENSTAGGFRKNQSAIFEFEGREFDPGLSKNNCWKHTAIETEDDFSGMRRMAEAGRLYVGKNQIAFRRYQDDFGQVALSSWWDGLGGAANPQFVVQTNSKIVERCILMSSEPGDLVLDPTCGSGTTAYAAEKWGRRWITIDSSRVAIAIARQRLLCSSFPYFRLKDDPKHDEIGSDPSAGFVCKRIGHVTSSKVANAREIDEIAREFETVLDEQLSNCNRELRKTDEKVRAVLREKLAQKTKRSKKKSITRADLLRWELPQEFEHWTVPFDTDKDWPKPLQEAVAQYRSTVSEKANKINKVVEGKAGEKELVDQPEVVSSILRVAGPYTVEGVRPEELSLDENGVPFDPTPNDWEPDDSTVEKNLGAYITRMIQLLRQDGVTFPNNKRREFRRVDQLDDSSSAIQAEGVWSDSESDDTNNVGVAFGPQYGPVTAEQVEDLIRASRRYDELVVAGFSFDGAAQEVIQESSNPRLQIHMAHIRPDVSPGMDDLLKDSPQSQLFTVFGQPEIDVEKSDEGFRVILKGVDVYSSLTGEIQSTGADKVFAWFLDSDYDGRCFCVTQAFFPNQKCWDSLVASLNGTADAEAFSAFKGTESLAFERGMNNRIAVKVIDPRGNEVMAIRSLEGIE